MNNDRVSPQLLSRLALAVIRKERTVDDLVAEYNTPQWLITEAVVRIVQGAHRLMEKAAPGHGPDNQRALSENVPDRMCFVHIEKTGGTSLASYLDDYYEAKEICPALLHEGLESLAMLRDLGEYRLFHGHYFLGWLLSNGLDFESTRFITVLRHPLQRVISSHKHWMSAPSSPHYMGPLISEHNGQCIHLSTLSMRKGYATMHDHLDSAKLALEKFFFVGIQERFSDSLAALANLLGCPMDSVPRQLNTSKHGDPALPAVLMDEILSSNYADLELYRYAVSLFERKFGPNIMSAMGASVVAKSTPLQDCVRFTMDQALSGSGWHVREGLDGKLPQPWRWTGPGIESSVRFHLNPNQQYLLSVRVVNSLTPTILESLRIHVNGVPIETARRVDTQWGQLLEGDVPRAALCADAPNTRIVFRVAETRKFCEVDPSSRDERYCGIAVSEINLVPV